MEAVSTAMLFVEKRWLHFSEPSATDSLARAPAVHRFRISPLCHTD